MRHAAVFPREGMKLKPAKKSTVTPYPKRKCALFLLLGVCVGGFVGMMVLGCGKQVLGVRAAKTTIERV